MSQKLLVFDQQRLKTQVILTVAATLIAKLLGFLRIQQIAVTLEISYFSDVLMIVLQLVWFLETVVVSGAVVPMLVSRIYQVDHHDGGTEAARLLLHAAAACSLASILVALLLYICSDTVISVLAPGFGETEKELFSSLILASVATPLALTLAHFSSLVNRLLGNGIWYSIPQIVTNTSGILALIAGFAWGGKVFAAEGMVLGLGIGAAAVCLLQFIVMPPAPRQVIITTLRTAGLRVFRHGHEREFWIGAGALMLAATVREAYIYVDFFFASAAGGGSVAAMGYASRLGGIVNMLVVASAFVIFEPRWANELIENGTKTWSKMIVPDALSMLSLIAAPIAVLFFFPDAVTDLIYHSSSFATDERNLLNDLVQVFAFGAFGLGLSLATSRMLVLAGFAKWIFKISLVVLLVKVALSAHLMESYGMVGLAAATVLAISIQGIANLLVLAYAGLEFPVGIASILRLLANFCIVFCVAFLLSNSIADGGMYFVGACVSIVASNVVAGFILKFNYTDFMYRLTRKKVLAGH